MGYGGRPDVTYEVYCCVKEHSDWNVEQIQNLLKKNFGHGYSPTTIKKIIRGGYDETFKNPDNRKRKRKKSKAYKSYYYVGQPDYSGSLEYNYRRRNNSNMNQKNKDSTYSHELETDWRNGEGRNSRSNSGFRKNVAVTIVVAIILCFFLNKMEGTEGLITLWLARISAPLLPIAQVAFAIGFIMLLIFSVKKNIKMVKIGGMLLLVGFAISSFNGYQTSVGIVLLAVVYIIASSL